MMVAFVYFRSSLIWIHIDQLGDFIGHTCPYRKALRFKRSAGNGKQRKENNEVSHNIVFKQLKSIEPLRRFLSVAVIPKWV